MPAVLEAFKNWRNELEYDYTLPSIKGENGLNTGLTSQSIQFCIGKVHSKQPCKDVYDVNALLDPFLSLHGRDQTMACFNAGLSKVNSKVSFQGKKVRK